MLGMGKFVFEPSHQGWRQIVIEEQFQAAKVRVRRSRSAA
jgi:hypothetical protein